MKVQEEGEEKKMKEVFIHKTKMKQERSVLQIVKPRPHSLKQPCFYVLGILGNLFPIT